MLYLFILCGLFLTIVFFVMGIYQLAFGSRLAVLERLKNSTSDDVVPEGPEPTVKKGFNREALAVLGILGRVLSRPANTKIIQKKLIQAHVLMRAEEFIGLTISCAVGLFLFIYLLSGNVLFAIPGILVGLKLPGLVLEMKKTSRTNKITEQLPEALNIISSGLRAGYSFPQALSVVSKEMSPPISEEFQRVIWENRMGKTMDETLRNLGERNDSEDLGLFITALVIQRQVGGNLAEILDNISHTIRERVRIQGEIRTLTIQGKMSAIIIILLPIFMALFLIFVNPDYIRLLVEDPIGIAMVIFAVLLQFVGIFVIRKVVNIDI